MASDKQDAADRLTSLLGLPRFVVTGQQAGTVPASIFVEAARRVGIPHKSRPETAEAIVRLAGLEWRRPYDSRQTDSRGGGNVTVPGLLALADALDILIGSVDAYLLTWNPFNYKWDERDLANDIMNTAQGTVVAGRWSTGNTKRIQPGDTVYLLRQGTEGNRGIVAAGTAASEVYQDRHWMVLNSSANYVDVDWARVVAPEDGIPLADLQAAFPTQQWEPQSSGTSIRPEVADGLARLWAAHVQPDASGRNGPRAPTGGQGRLLDAERRKKLENAAQDRLEQTFRDDGWIVEDMRQSNPYDARATKGNQTIYLEAKGTQTSGKHVIVTRGEVKWATAHPNECVIGIWSGMRFRPDGEIDLGAGSFTLFEWFPDDEDDLVPIDFDWYPPDSKRL